MEGFGDSGFKDCGSVRVMHGDSGSGSRVWRVVEVRGAAIGFKGSGCGLLLAFRVLCWRL